MYDVALRVPLIIRWPGVVKRGTVIRQLASNVDTYATILGMLGIPRPPGTAPESRDLSPLLRGETRTSSDTIFAEYTPDQIGAMQFSRMVRTPGWKLVRNYLNPGGNELYDLEADPDEMHNLYYRDLRGYPMEADSGQSHRIHPHPYASVLGTLQRSLEAWQRRIGDPALDLDARYQEAKARIRRRWNR
jgi:arylsulfatase A-like enzyme